MARPIMPTADTHTSVRHSNTVGILAMLASMAFFVANDTCVKLIGEKLPLGELILLRNTAATIYILAFAAASGGASAGSARGEAPVESRLVGVAHAASATTPRTARRRHASSVRNPW